MLIVGDENETTSFALVNVSLIAVCVLVTIATYSAQISAESIIKTYGCVPARFFGLHNPQEFLTLLTSMFLHGGLLHLLGNMWYLYIFGDNIEDHFGHFNYLAFYLTCGIISGLAQAGSEPSSMLPCVGASGAIAGVLGAYLVLYPHARVKTWWGDDSIFFAFRSYMVPAWTVIGFWFFMQAVCMSMKIPGIGWHAHIFGFLTGIAIVGVYRLFDKKCSDSHSVIHNGETNQMARAYASRQSLNTQMNSNYGAGLNGSQKSINFAKPMMVILALGALAFGGTYLAMHHDAPKAQASVAIKQIDELPTKPAATTSANSHPAKNKKAKHRVKHGKHNDVHHAVRKQAIATS